MIASLLKLASQRFSRSTIRSSPPPISNTQRAPCLPRPTRQPVLAGPGGRQSPISPGLPASPSWPGQGAGNLQSARDRLIAAALFIGGLIAYISTLAPTVLDGDAALFQYTPSVLGVTYPTGYPTYILLGRLWTMLVPIGSIAYRMNLFSAVCGALALPFLYSALRRLLESRLAALTAVLIFATLPTYWRWATEAKIYALHILFLSGILFLLTRCSQSASQRVSESASQPLGAGGWGLKAHGFLAPTTSILLAAFLFGLALGNHSTTLLLAPGLFLLFWLNCRPLRTIPYATRNTQHVARLTRYLLPIVFLPLLLYLYIPLRAEWLLAREGTLPGLRVPVAVAHGLVTDFYHSGLDGLVRYFTAADFTGGVVTNWGLVPRQLVTVYWPLVRDDFTPWGAILGLVGAVYFAIWRPRRFWPLSLMYAILIPFVLTYGQGEQSAFLLPSSLMLAIFDGAAVAGGVRLISRIGNQDSGIRGSGIGDQGIRDQGSEESGIRESGIRESGNEGSGDWRSVRMFRFPDSLIPDSLLSAVLTLGLMAAVAWLPVRQAQRNIDWLTQKWDDAAYQYWTDALAHPMEPGAGILADWGDLTSFWYLQHVEQVRPDLYGLYPLTEEVVVEWLAAGHNLYIAGPLQGWGAGVEARYQLLPWGRLVRLAPRDANPLRLLPKLPDAPDDAVFGEWIRLLKSDFGAHTPSGGILPVTLAWQTIGDLPADTDVSLRLVDDDGVTLAQIDEALVSGWLPADSLPSDQVMLSFHRFKLPAGTLPGDYRLQLALFQPHGGGWSLADGRPTLELGQVRVTSADPSRPPDPWGEYKPLRGVNFGGQIRLVGYDYSVTRAGQGKGFAARFLWQASRPPAADYTLLVELVDADGRVWRDWHHVPTDGRAPTSTWAAAHPVRDHMDLVLPADAPPGENTLYVRISWERADGTHLPAHRWFLPAGDSVTLPGVRVVEKEGRLFEPPPMQHAACANFDDKIQLLGYNLPVAHLSPGDSLPLTLIWQSLTSDMRESYTVFVHLVGPDGTIYGQWDKAPGERGKQPTTGWVAGEVIIDPIPVPLSPHALPGTYRMLVGLYLAPDGPRLPLRDESGAIIDDALELTKIEVDK